MGAAGVVMAGLLTIAVRGTSEPREFWAVVALSDYLFPAHGFVLAPPDSPGCVLLVAYLAGFAANAMLYAILGLGAGSVEYAVRRLRQKLENNSR
jgi:hypothetical protein